MGPPLDADALPQYYDMPSFSYCSLKTRNVGPIVHVMQSNSMPDVISNDD